MTAARRGETITARTVFSGNPVVPVVVIDDPDQAVPLGQALLAGGINIVEITLRTPAGLEAIRALAELDDLSVGAGTVLFPDQVDEVVSAGARFVVSPGLAVDVVERCRSLHVETLPGVATATDLMTAATLGIDFVKFFPAGPLGGPATIRALSAPFPDVTFVPSGGVTVENMTDYLDVDAVAAVSGSWMVTPELLGNRGWAEVTRRSRTAIEQSVVKR